MGKNGVPQRRIRKSRVHCDLHGTDDFAGFNSNDGETEDAVALHINERFHETASLGKRLRSQDRSDRILQGDRNAALTRFVFAEADTGELWISEHKMEPGGRS